MKNLTFSLNNVVRVHINFGESKNQNLIVEFFKFLAENNINHVPDPMEGLEIYVGYFASDDAISVKNWLLKQGAEIEELPLNPILNKVKNLIIGLQMFLDHVNVVQMEKLAQQVMREINPGYKDLLFTKLDEIPGYSQATRSFAKSLRVKLYEASKKGQLIPKEQLSRERVLSMKVRDIFSCRTSYRLHSDGIYTISELIDAMKGRDIALLHLINFGKNSIDEVNAFLRLYNL